MHELREWLHYLWRSVKMWLNWLKPTSSFVAKLSLGITFAGAVIWVLVRYKIIDTESLWKDVGLWGFWVGIGISALMLLFWAPYKINKADKEQWANDINELKGRVKELHCLEEYRLSQQGHENDWLHLVVERFEFDRDVSSRIWVTFNFDSGLTYNFKPFRLWVTPIIDGYEASEPQYEFAQTPNFLRGKRSQESSKAITVKDPKLQELINQARTLNRMKKALKVSMQLEPNGQLMFFTGEMPK